jgi:hypothetical protein
MKNTMIRIFVVALALTGAVSTAHSNSTARAFGRSGTGFPVPLCPPNDPQGCGIQ